MDNYCNCGRELCTNKIDLFKKLPLDIQKEIVIEAEHFQVQRDETIINEGDLADHILVIREGKLKCNHYDFDGKEYILDILITGDTVGEELFMEKSHFDYNVISITSSKLCRISKEQLLSLLRKNSDWALSFIDLLSEKLNNANERIRMLMEANGLRRVVAFLAERDERLGGKAISLSVDEIAASTNLRRETVSRKINELQKRGLIERLGQKQIKVTDRAKLMEIFYES
ncbi:MAG: Crp/Fnr family transcriptional regulator [Tissierellia bacterium]|nr:Crp/Fnr family transcriptional regulator [Tissierellia bacterium]